MAGPLGYFSRTPKRGTALYLLVWAAILPVQTAVVHADDPDDINALYFLLNAVILAGGLALNALGRGFRERRAARDGVKPARRPRRSGAFA